MSLESFVFDLRIVNNCITSLRTTSQEKIALNVSWAILIYKSKTRMVVKNAIARACRPYARQPI